MKLMVLLVSLVSIIGSGLLFWHQPVPHQSSSLPAPIARVSLPSAGPGIGNPSPVKPPSTGSTISNDKREVIHISGSADVIPLINDIRGDFENAPNGPKVETKATSIDEAKRRVDSSTAFEFALINREQSDDEKYLKANPVAYRGVCLIVNKNNPVASLDETQISAIYLGTTVAWKDAGGSDAPVSIYQFVGSRNPSKSFYNYFKLKEDKIVNAIAQSEDYTEILRRVGTDAGGLAFVPYVAVSAQETRDQNKIKLIAIKGIDPSAASIRDGSYPLGFPVILLTRGEPEDGPARNFLRYITSDPVQDKLRANLLLPGR